MRILAYLILMLAIVYFINKLFTFFIRFITGGTEQTNNTRHDYTKSGPVKPKIKDEDIIDVEFEELEETQEKKTN